jgi:hypothetical protein
VFASATEFKRFARDNGWICKYSEGVEPFVIEKRNPNKAQIYDEED